MTLRQTSKSFASRRLHQTQTPFSTTSITSKLYPKQQVNISDVYSQMKQKLNEMQSAFKSQNLSRQRQMLKTYMKILDKIGQQVIQAKQKYRNLNKQNLKTDKRLQIVTQLNKQRSQCNQLTINIKQVRQQIKMYSDQNNYLQKQVQALKSIQTRKRQLSKSQKIKYRAAIQYQSKSLEKSHKDENDKLQEKNNPIMFSSKQSTQMSKTYDLKNRAKSFIINNFNEKQDIQFLKNKQKETINELKTQERPSTTLNNNKYLGNKRVKIKLVNSPFQQKNQYQIF